MKTTYYQISFLSPLSGGRKMGPVSLTTKTESVTTTNAIEFMETSA
jgi:hypothetical protein